MNLGLFHLFKSKQNRRRLSQQIEPLLLMLDYSIHTVSPLIVEQIRTWDLTNRSLLLTLGYIAGYIDAAYQFTKPSNYDEDAVDGLFIDRARKHLSAIRGSELFFEINRHPVGNSISGLQCDKTFLQGMTAGGRDFVDFVNDKRSPLTLMKLLLAESVEFQQKE